MALNSIDFGVTTSIAFVLFCSSDGGAFIAAAPICYFYATPQEMSVI